MSYPDNFSSRAFNRYWDRASHRPLFDEHKSRSQKLAEQTPTVHLPRGLNERKYERTTDNVLRQTRANLIDREGLAMWIDARSRDRMIREIDQEIALRATTTPTE